MEEAETGVKDGSLVGFFTQAINNGLRVIRQIEQS